MKKFNEESHDIDIEGDDLIIKFHIYNSELYDVLNRQMKKTDSVIEINIINCSSRIIEINNPELIIYELESYNSNIAIYNSSNLQKLFPLSISPNMQYSFAYNSKNMLYLLKENFGEVFKFQILSTTGKFYQTVGLNGDQFELYIENRDKMTTWNHKDVYDFDNKI